MRFTKVISAVSAVAVAASMVGVNAFAAEEKGSVTMSDSTWWTQEFLINTGEGKLPADFFGSVDLNSDFTITLTGTGDFVVGYNGADGTWKQYKASEFGGTIVVKKSDFPEKVDDWGMLVALSNADNKEYTIEWTVSGSDKPADAPAEDTDTSAEEEETTALLTEEAPAEDEAAEEEAVEEDAEESLEEEAVPADVPAEDEFTSALESDGFVKIADGGESSNWGQAVKKQTYNNLEDGDVAGADILYTSLLNENTAVVVTYESAQAPEMILQSWSGGEGWAKIPVNETYSTDGVAVFTYDYMTAMYGSDDFSTVDCFYIGDTGVDLKVTEVDVVDISTLGDSEEAPAEEEAPAAEEAPAEEAPAVAEQAPAADASTAPVATGNMSPAALAGIIAVAGAAAVALRKRK